MMEATAQEPHTEIVNCSTQTPRHATMTAWPAPTTKQQSLQTRAIQWSHGFTTTGQPNAGHIAALFLQEGLKWQAKHILLHQQADGLITEMGTLLAQTLLANA